MIFCRKLLQNTVAIPQAIGISLIQNITFYKHQHKF